MLNVLPAKRLPVRLDGGMKSASPAGREEPRDERVEARGGARTVEERKLAPGKVLQLRTQRQRGGRHVCIPASRQHLILGQSLTPTTAAV